jgi:O-antigen ligase
MNRWLLASTVALLPLLVPRGPGESAPVDVVAVLYIVLALASLARRARGLQLPAKGPLLVILTASLLATMFSLSVAHSMQSLLIEAYLVTLLACVATELSGDKRGLRFVLTAWSVTALVWAALLIGFKLQLLPDTLQQLLLESSDKGGSRVAGPSKNPNLAASYMMTSFFVLLASPWPRHRPARLLAAAWLLAGLLVTGSNGALLGVAVGLAVVAAAAGLRAGRTPHQRLASVGAALVACGLVACGAVLAFGLPRVTVTEIQAVAAAERERGGLSSESIGRIDRGVQGRLEIWKRAWNGAGSRVLIGVGPSSAAQIPSPRRPLGRELHNDYVAFLIERGVLGLLGLLGLLGVMLHRSVRLLGPSAEGRWRLAGLGGAVVANLGLAASHESFHFRHLWILFGLVWAAAAVVTDHPPLSTASSTAGSEQRGELVHAGN